ncbi:unnamed protein product [Lactuca saligna]|uniref:Zinc finger GRF-type domain-containing protein n=1 Tax=Lactuca saligna TaxID=75948 RepID=A0AA35ZVT9_LACSI|nr:unnamed protein product [Lactuca saligna]
MVRSSNTHTQGYKEWALRNHWSEDLRCDCDAPATFSISKTVDNPWRKFRGCPNYQVILRLQKNVAFLWLDPPLPNTYYKETIWKFHMDLEEANNNKAFTMEVLKLSEEAKNNKEFQVDILNLLKVELLMMVMLLVVVTVMGFMVHNVMVKAL